MPYFIQYTWESGLVDYLGPIVPDNHKSEHGLEDRRIKKVCDKTAKAINKISDDVVCKAVYQKETDNIGAGSGD